MSDLFQSVNSMTETENGALSLSTSADAVVDFFFQVGASRGNPVKALFTFGKGMQCDEDLTVRTLLWARDAREGAGERQTFRDLLKFVATKDVELAKRILVKIPELGRWDDAVAMFNTSVGVEAMAMCLVALAGNDQLCAKWMPREKSKWKVEARLFREFAELTPRQYRKLLSQLSNTLEQKMCAKLWAEIEYNHVPSVAAARYQAAFNKNDETRYSAYKEALTDGEAKVNAAAIFPHDVIKGRDEVVKEAQWKALPDFLNGNTTAILPMVDVSGSMDTAVAGSTTAMDIAIGLGLYVAERTTGQFKNQYISFSEEPVFGTVDTSLTLAQRIQHMEHDNVGYSTNFQAAFDLILQTAVRFKLTQEQLPEVVLVLSDMEFNQAESSWRSSAAKTNFEAVDAKFKAAGYARPGLVFWNLNSRTDAIPVRMDESGTALVSGFSPSILKSLLANPLEMNPLEIVLGTINNPRYDY